MSPSLFKKSGAAAVKFKEANKQEINSYSQMLAGIGYALVGTPIEFRAAMSISALRDSARKYAHENGCSLIVEVKDPNPMANPFNPYKYYLYQYQGAQPLPDPMEPPSKGGGAVAGGQAAQQVAAFICPYCQQQFNAYVQPGPNTITCTGCRGQSMVEMPAAGAAAGAANQSSDQMAQIKLSGGYTTVEEMIVDCCEVLGKIMMIEGNPIQFEDTGEFLYPFILLKQHGYQHIGFRKMDLYLVREATHDYKIFGSEVHTQSQSTINPLRDDLFAIKVLGGLHYMVLDEFKKLEDDQKREISTAFYEFLTRYVSVSS